MGTGAEHETVYLYTMATGFPIHCLIATKNLVHGTSYNLNFFSGATSNHAPTIIQYYYREASTLVIQHACVILRQLWYPKHSLVQPDSLREKGEGEGEGESLVKCYTSSCPSTSYEARPIRLHL